jgi:hypothetical protein
MCPPLLSGRSPTSSLIWGHPTSYGALDFLPVCRLCHPTPCLGGPHRTSRVPDSAVVTCRGHRPRWARGAMAVGPSDVAFRDSQHVGTHTFILMTGLIPFTLTHCGPSPPCVRFAAGVTDYDATLGTRCLAKASGAGAFPRLTKPNFARRTRIGEIPYARRDLLGKQSLPGTPEKSGSHENRGNCF